MIKGLLRDTPFLALFKELQVNVKASGKKRGSSSQSKVIGSHSLRFIYRDFRAGTDHTGSRTGSAAETFCVVNYCR